ncbi:hypothetical protein [Alteribacter aurantiacus]|uniref:hypothetical protein n=1 Tax=Alteribacter aurantiacus TaxID=254410 RepID=UPI00040BA7C0|nr:hypothetical protein [Alteribacter aurantiacus]
MGGLKALELQVVLPRTQMAGKIQDQLQQRGQVTQSILTKESSRLDKVKRKVITPSEKTSLHIATDLTQQNASYDLHPYIGRTVDISK